MTLSKTFMAAAMAVTTTLGLFVATPVQAAPVTTTTIGYRDYDGWRDDRRYDRRDWQRHDRRDWNRGRYDDRRNWGWNDRRNNWRGNSWRDNRRCWTEWRYDRWADRRVPVRRCR